MLLEGVVITEGGLLSSTESGGDGIAGDTGDGGLRVGNKHTVLHVKSTDFRERVADELGDDGEDFCSVHSQARAVEGGITHAVGVEIASIRITRACNCVNTAS